MRDPSSRAMAMPHEAHHCSLAFVTSSSDSRVAGGRGRIGSFASKGKLSAPKDPKGMARSMSGQGCLSSSSTSAPIRRQRAPQPGWVSGLLLLARESTTRCYSATEQGGGGAGDGGGSTAVAPHAKEAAAGTERKQEGSSEDPDKAALQSALQKVRARSSASAQGGAARGGRGETKEGTKDEREIREAFIRGREQRAVMREIQQCNRSGDWRRVAVILGEAKRRGVALNAFHYNEAIDALGATKRFKGCLALYAEMKEAGIKPSPKICKVIMVACGKLGEAELARELMDELVSQGEAPTVVEYSILQSALCRAGSHDSALALLDDMKAQGLSPDGRNYCTCMNALKLAGKDPDQVLDLLHEMIDRGVPRAARHYTIILGSLIGRQRNKMALDVFTDILLEEPAGCVDEFHYELAVNAASNCGQHGAVLRLLKDMEREGFKRGKLAWLAGLRAHNVMEEYRETLELWAGLLAEGEEDKKRGEMPKVRPDTRHFAAVMRAAKELGGREALRVVEEMLDLGLRPTTACFEGAIDCCAKWEGEEAEEAQLQHVRLFALLRKAVELDEQRPGSLRLAKCVELATRVCEAAGEGDLAERELSLLVLPSLGAKGEKQDEGGNVAEEQAE